MAKEGGYQFRDPEGTYFVTCTVVQWVDVFTWRHYADMLLDSFRYCQNHKGLVIHAWCIMSNHIHFIFTSKLADPSGLLRDFKKHTSNTILAGIIHHPKESRMEWMINIFKKAGVANSRNTNYQFWQQHNHPIHLYSTKFLRQRMNYLHRNPVKAGIVREPHEYILSSAIDYSGGKGLLDIEYLY